MKQVLIPILLSILFTSCERYDDVELDVPYKPKVVIACFLQGQSSTAQVAVTRSLPVFNVDPKPGYEASPEYITDATVLLQKGANTYRLTYDTIQKLYQVDLPAIMQAGEQYELTVISGDVTSKGNTVIPGKVNVAVQLRFDSTLNEDGTYQYHALLNYSPLDPGKHYLDFYPILVYNDSSMDMMYSEEVGIISELNQGQTLSRSYTSSYSAIGVSPVRIDLMVANCDKGFARNINRIMDMLGTLNLSPFTDPAITYSNMSGGAIGIMGSYNPETRISFNLK